MPSDPASFPHSCKQNQDLLSFYAVVMGLDNAAVSRLRLTWEVRRPLPSLPTAPEQSCRLRICAQDLCASSRYCSVGSLCANGKQVPSSGLCCSGHIALLVSLQISQKLESQLKCPCSEHQLGLRQHSLCMAPV